MSTSLSSDASPPPVPYGGRLMFTQSWEDPVCDVRAVAPKSGETMLAITSGGDNVLGFLLTDPATVWAIDLNPLQTFLLELKMTAFRRLEHPDLLTLMGVRAPAAAEHLYAALRMDLSAPARAFWDGRSDWFAAGLLTQGGFERYHALLRSLIRVVVGRGRIERLFSTAPGDQRTFYEMEWNSLGWRALIRIGCSRLVMGRRLDRSWFTDAEVPDFGAHFAGLAEHAIAELPVRSNYFLAQILRGEYLDEQAVPDYLRDGNFETIRSRLDRIRPVTADIGAALAGLPDRSVDTFALSNVFEYSPAALFERARGELRRVARPGARFSLRNLLAPRRLSDDPAWQVDAELSAELQRADRGFIYARFEAARLRELSR